MIHIREIDHIVLRITDLETILRFYCDILGCKVERCQEELGLTQLRAGHSLIDLVTVNGELGRSGGSSPGPEGRNMAHLCLRIEPFDAEAIYAHLNRHGVKAVEGRSRYGAESEGPSLYLNDPEGNIVELKGEPWSR
jgi:catechol 2,3-dioxygenase-like lactoylglutathione lyase family enzyme